MGMGLGKKRAGKKGDSHPKMKKNAQDFKKKK